MKIQITDKRTHEHVSKLIEERLAELGRELGIRFESRGGHYGDVQPDFKLIVHTTGPDGEIEAPEVKAFRAHSWVYNISPDDLNRSILIEGDWMKITGLMVNSRVRPICVVREYDNKSFVYPAKNIREAIITTKMEMKNITPGVKVIL